MNVNGVSSSRYASSADTVKSAKAATKAEKATETAKEAETAAAVKEDAAAVYTKSANKYSDMSDSDRAALVKQLEADMQTHKENMINLVKQMLGQQTTAYAQAKYGNGEDGIWKFLASGDYKVDAQTQAEAQQAISEDGYWGVEQTSDRIVKYAQALSGGDPAKLETMIDAVKKGFKEAEKAWGGKLPGITDQTYSAVMDKFDKIKEQYGAASA